jgi:hypothetical protein
VDEEIPTKYKVQMFLKPANKGVKTEAPCSARVEESTPAGAQGSCFGLGLPEREEDVSLFSLQLSNFCTGIENVQFFIR